MKAAALSLLHYPFPDLVNPGLDAMERYAAQVTDECVELDPYLREKIKDACPGALIARFYPLAGPEYVFTMVRYLIFAFIVEDTYTRLPYSELALKCNRATAFLRDGIVLPGDEIAIRQLKHCLDEAGVLEATPLWLQRFAQHNDEFYQSLLTETTYYNNQEAVRYPALEDCIRYREDQTDVYPFIDYIELILNFTIPEALYEHHYIQRLRQLTARFIVYVNDLYSIEKDLYNREIMNVVLVIQQAEDCSLEEAQVKALQLHDKELTEFLLLCSVPPDFGPYNGPLRKYIQHLQLFIQGNLSWHKISKRYVDYIQH